MQILPQRIDLDRGRLYCIIQKYQNRGKILIQQPGSLHPWILIFQQQEWMYLQNIRKMCKSAYFSHFSEMFLNRICFLMISMSSKHSAMPFQFFCSDTQEVLLKVQSTRHLPICGRKQIRQLFHCLLPQCILLDHF